MIDTSNCFVVTKDIGVRNVYRSREIYFTLLFLWPSRLSTLFGFVCPSFVPPSWTSCFTQVSSWKYSNVFAGLAFSICSGACGWLMWLLIHQPNAAASWHWTMESSIDRKGISVHSLRCCCSHSSWIGSLRVETTLCDLPPAPSVYPGSLRFSFSVSVKGLFSAFYDSVFLPFMKAYKSLKARIYRPSRMIDHVQCKHLLGISWSRSIMWY